jgi:hypothetical protein
MFDLYKLGFWLATLVILTSIPVRAAEEDPMACVGEIERVCVQLEDHLETCLSDRGSQLSAACRDQLKTAMSLAQDPSGPAACIPDVQRLCPDMKPQALAKCIGAQQSNFSAACQQYLQSARSGAPAK